MKKILSLCKNNLLLQSLLLCLAGLIAFNQSLSLFFVLDDYGVIYDLQHQIALPYPYHYSVQLFYPIYKLALLNPFPYFLFGFFTYLLSILVFFFFMKEMVNKKWIAFLCALTYATAPIGMEGTFRFSTYAWTYILNIVLLGAIFFLIRFRKTKKYFYYLLSLLTCFFILEIAPYRAFFFVPIVLICDLFRISNQKYTLRSIFLHAIPFILLFGGYYLFQAPLMHEAQVFTNFQIGSLNKVIVRTLHTPFLLLPLESVLNILYGGIVIPLSMNLTFANHQFVMATNGSTLTKTNLVLPLGILMIGLILFLSLSQTKNSGEQKRLLLLSIVWIYINIIAFYIVGVPGITETNARIIAYSLPAYALFVYALFSLIAKYFKKDARDRYLVIAFIVLIVVNTICTNLNFLYFHKLRTNYTRQFFATLHSLLPQLSPGSLIYLQSPEKPYLRSRLRWIYAVGLYGGETTFAIYYGLSNNQIDLAEHFEEVQKYLSKNPKNLQQIHSFNYDESGLHDQTEKVKKQLKSGDAK